MHVSIAHGKAKEAYDALLPIHRDQIGPMPGIEKCGDETDCPRDSHMDYARDYIRASREEIRKKMYENGQLNTHEKDLWDLQDRVLSDYFEANGKDK